MYDIKTEPETLCRGCLSAGRKLSYLSNYDLYWSLLKEDQRLQEFIFPEVAMCWECSAMLRRMQVFQARVQRAQAVLQELAPITSPLSSLTYNLKKEYDAIFKENLEENYEFDTFAKDEMESVEKEQDLKEEAEYVEERESLHNDSDHRSFDDDLNDKFDDFNTENNLDTSNTTRRSKRKAAKDCLLKITNTKQQAKGLYASIKALSEDLRLEKAKKRGKKQKPPVNNKEEESIIILQVESEHVTSRDPVIDKLEAELTRIINKRNATRKRLHSKGERIKLTDIYDGSSDDWSDEDTDDLDSTKLNPENIDRSEYDNYKDLKKTQKNTQKKKKPDSDPEFEVHSDSDSDIDKRKKKKVDNDTETEVKTYKNRMIYKRLIIKYDNFEDVLPYFTEVEMSEEEIRCALEEEDAIVRQKKPWRCDECGRYLPNKRVLVYHKKRMHRPTDLSTAPPPEPPRSLWRCALCPRLLRRHHTVAHMNDYHRYQHICIEQECQWSSKVFWCREDFEAHWDSCHRLLTCHYCRKRTKSKKVLAEHIEEKHLGRLGLRCPSCRRRFPTRGRLLDHERRCAPRQPPELRYCVECDRTYKTVTYYRMHVSNVHGPKKSKQSYPCSVCGKVLLSKLSYDSHYALFHVGKTKYQCHLCGKYFHKAQGLELHLNSHNNVKLPKDKPCGVCGRMFRDSRVLRFHMYTHTGERPYKCSHCDAAFTQPYPLRMHLFKTHGIQHKPKRGQPFGKTRQGLQVQVGGGDAC